MKLTIELDIEKACYFDAVGGIDIPAKVGKVGYSAHLQIPCIQACKRIINELKQEATDG